MIVALVQHYSGKFIQDGGIIYALRGRHDGGIIYARWCLRIIAENLFKMAAVLS